MARIELYDIIVDDEIKYSNLSQEEHFEKLQDLADEYYNSNSAIAAEHIRIHVRYEYDNENENENIQIIGD